MSEQPKTINDGGSAYPIYTPDMNVIDDAGPGISIRALMAKDFLAAMLASGNDCGLHPNVGYAIEQADALIAGLDHVPDAGEKVGEG